jgi:hypothetical protein
MSLTIRPNLARYKADGSVEYAYVVEKNYIRKSELLMGREVLFFGRDLGGMC